MRTSKYLLSTLKEIPVNTEITSHKLMLRAGMIRQLSSGLYTWLPTGLRVLHKITDIIRQEMQKIGALEISMPIVQPATLWKKSNRWTKYGAELLRFKNRNSQQFVLGPTNEEVIAYLIRNEINSYKQLPLNLYQIKTKFRDEIRPRFGVIRAREFIMKDGYSFHINQKSLQNTYDDMCQAYETIFTRIELDFCVVQADSGTIGGHISHEFQALTDKNEDNIIFSKSSNCTTNINLATTVTPNISPIKPKKIMKLVKTSTVHTIHDLTKQFNLPIEKIVKILIVHAKQETGCSLIALMIRADHQLNKTKVEKIPQVKIPLSFANEEEIRLNIGSGSSFLGPINLPLPLIIDRDVATMSDFIAGSNIDGQHFFGINWIRDLPLPKIADLRKVVNRDLKPNEKGILNIKHRIEVGHIFQLGSKYSDAINVTVQGNNGRTFPLIMGCYGIGITRVIAATIEQNNDKLGIIWPEAVAPFSVAILPINMHKSCHVNKIAEDLYKQFSNLGIDVLLDDRNEHPGIMFNDLELIGIPHTIIIGDNNLNTKEIEYKNRRTHKREKIKINTIVNFLTKKILFEK